MRVAPRSVEPSRLRWKEEQWSSSLTARRGVPPAELERVRDADPELLAALAAYLDRNPRRRGERPSWLAVALWADELVEGKPTAAAVAVALYELRRATA